MNCLGEEDILFDSWNLLLLTVKVTTVLTSGYLKILHRGNTEYNKHSMAFITHILISE